MFIISLASSLEEISCLAGGSLRLIFWRSFVNTKDFRLVSQIRDWEQIKRSKLSRERKETFLWIRVLFGDWWIWMDCVAVSTFFLLRRTHLFVHRVDHQNSLKFLQMDFWKVHHNCTGNFINKETVLLHSKEESSLVAWRPEKVQLCDGQDVNKYY